MCELKRDRRLDITKKKWGQDAYDIQRSIIAAQVYWKVLYKKLDPKSTPNQIERQN